MRSGRRAGPRSFSTPTATARETTTWNRTSRPIRPRDTRISAGYYGVAVNPVDGSIWGSSLGFPGAVLRLDPGPDPATTALVEIYMVPWGTDATRQGYSPRGMDIDRNGVVWTPLASGHMASFDRSKCTAPLNGPEATGRHCPEGWTLYPEPLPQLAGLTDSGSAESSYYTWVDQFDTLGLGANVPINTGNGSEGLLALQDGEWVVMRVPYPLGFYTKWMDGRIDDPDAGWKGKGLWATYSTRTPFHLEGGKGTTSKVVKFPAEAGPARAVAGWFRRRRGGSRAHTKVGSGNGRRGHRGLLELQLTSGRWCRGGPRRRKLEGRRRGGGQDTYGPYELVENWPRGLPDGPDGVTHDGWTWGSMGSVFAETPDRIWVAMRGELPLPEGAEAWTPYPMLRPPLRATGNDDGLSATCEPRPVRGWERRYHHVIFVLDGDGNMVQDWSQHNELFDMTCGARPAQNQDEPV